MSRDASRNGTSGVDDMLDVIRTNVYRTQWMTGREAVSERVLAAMHQVPRQAFVDAELQDAAWRDMPLPIGHRQTISQPFMVALMTDLIEPEPDHVVLDVGTGSGYQAAVLAMLVKQVHSVEVVADLAQKAAKRLASRGYTAVHVHHGDGHAGWPEGAPYDGILVAAASPSVPPALLAQLKPGGRMVMPIGPWYDTQQLTLFRKDASGHVEETVVLHVEFVPFISAKGPPVPPS